MVHFFDFENVCLCILLSCWFMSRKSHWHLMEIKVMTLQWLPCTTSITTDFSALSRGICHKCFLAEEFWTLSIKWQQQQWWQKQDILNHEVGLSWDEEIKVFQHWSYKIIVKLSQILNLQIEHIGDIWALQMMISNGRNNLQAVNKYMWHNASN